MKNGASREEAREKGRKGECERAKGSAIGEEEGLEERRQERAILIRDLQRRATHPGNASPTHPLPPYTPYTRAWL